MLQNYLSDIKPHYYWRYFVGIFVSFTSPEHLEAFRNFLNCRHTNMSFITENEKQNRMSFLDVQIVRKGKEFHQSAVNQLLLEFTHI